MKNTCLILLMALIACQPSPGTDKSNPDLQDADTLSQDNSAAQQSDAAKLIVKKEADYSPDFLTLLRENTDFESFHLDGNRMIVNGTDTAYFSQEPPIGKNLVLSAKKESLAITIRLKRINQTTVDYTIEMVESEKLVFIESGKADISPFFFLGAESDESDISGESYFVTEFIIESKDCYTAIRIGKEENSGSGFLGKLIMNCNGSNNVRDIGLDNFPTLRER